jgi:hypothetical protein
MEFLNSIFSRGINLSLIRLEFLSGFFLLSFIRFTTAIHENTQVFLFRGFFERIFKTREEYGFLLNPPVEGTVNSMEQKTQAFC